MGSVKLGSLDKERFLLGSFLPGALILVALPLGLVSAHRSSLPWAATVRYATLCILGALVLHLLSRRLGGARFEIADGKLHVVSGVLRKQYSMSSILGPVKLSESWIPIVSFKVGRVRHWYSIRGLGTDERKALLAELSAAAANNL